MKLVWSDPAVSDLEAIHDYIGQDSEFYAASYIAKILKAVDRLETFPKLGRNVPEAPEDTSIRELMVQSHRVIYRVSTGHILILAVLHGHRDISHSKLEMRRID